MGSMSDYMLDLEAERFDAWMVKYYPEVAPGSDEWEQVGLLHYWEQEALAEQTLWEHKHGLFVASLNSVYQRYLHANQELKKRWALLDHPQPELVYRMSFAKAERKEKQAARELPLSRFPLL